ncbi:unnamed protein product, partial [Gongylonema pulchrum]|uniref:P-type domain-containing protein n=1 Tax=Gongylonema pulchrum TaxID=637853 RepID=A0A183EAY6_9BILA
MFEASLNGATVARPVFFEFRDDPNTHELSHQIMWGSALLFVPVVYEGAESVKGYLPPSATWYSIRDIDYGYRIVKTGWSTFAAPTTGAQSVKGYLPPSATWYSIRDVDYGYRIVKTGWSTFAAPTTVHIPVFIRAYDENGNALPAHGQLFWDDGETLSGLKVPPLEIIDILGYEFRPDSGSMKINDASISEVLFNYEPKTKRLLIRKHELLNLATARGHSDALRWTHSGERGDDAVPIGERVDCNPSPGASQQMCLQHNCIWDGITDHDSNPTVPLCYVPPNSGYIITKKMNYGSYPKLALSSAPYGATNPYGANISPITF